MPRSGGMVRLVAQRNSFLPPGGNGGGLGDFGWRGCEGRKLEGSWVSPVRPPGNSEGQMGVSPVTPR